MSPCKHQNTVRAEMPTGELIGTFCLDCKQMIEVADLSWLSEEKCCDCENGTKTRLGKNLRIISPCFCKCHKPDTPKPYTDRCEHVGDSFACGNPETCSCECHKNVGVDIAKEGSDMTIIKLRNSDGTEEELVCHPKSQPEKCRCSDSSCLCQRGEETTCDAQKTTTTASTHEDIAYHEVVRDYYTKSEIDNKIEVLKMIWELEQGFRLDKAKRDHQFRTELLDGISIWLESLRKKFL